MRTLSIFLIFILAFNLDLSSQDKVKFQATGVTCSMCSNAIHKSLKSDKSILKIEPNLETQEWNLEYRQGDFTTEKLIKRVEDAGFSVSKIYLNNNLVFENKRKKVKKK